MNGAPIQPRSSRQNETRARLAWLACAFCPGPLGWLFSTIVPLFPWMLLVNVICSFAGVNGLLRGIPNKASRRMLTAYIGLIVFVVNIVILFWVEYSKTGHHLR